MTEITPIELDDGTIIWIEATEDVTTAPIKVTEPTTEPTEEEEEEGLSGKGELSPSAMQKQAVKNFQAIQSTIRAYTNYTLNAFKQVAIANVDKVTLEFGIKIGGETGIPYVTKGTAESNLKITVECSFPNPLETELE
ncbi:MAG: hypothetical protein MUE44_04510 [Oscillatoriaceae cyanobacterium Prado104]|jgi:hypothetical protein|nr:hypothetical protein [Oscillatoriaceae cyanobacterium Prado104]